MPDVNFNTIQYNTIKYNAKSFTINDNQQHNIVAFAFTFAFTFTFAFAPTAANIINQYTIQNYYIIKVRQRKNRVEVAPAAANIANQSTIHYYYIKKIMTAEDYSRSRAWFWGLGVTSRSYSVTGVGLGGRSVTLFQCR
jgi:hypothetical protein